MLKLLFLGFFAVIPSLCQKLTASENDYRLLTCGRAPKGPPLTGQEIKGSDAPWMAIVTRKLSHALTGDKYAFDATVISARHIITTSFSFFDPQYGPVADMNNCKNGWFELPAAAVELASGVSCTRAVDCRKGFQVAVKRMFFIGECKKEGIERGVVLVELETDLGGENEAVPACIAESQTKVAIGETLKVYSFKYHPKSSTTGMDTKVVKCPGWIASNNYCMDNKGCLAAEMGEGYVKMVDEQWTLVSVANNLFCDNNVDPGGPDLAHLSKRICDLSGICETTTLPRPYTPPEVKRNGRMLNKKQNEDLLKKCGVVKNTDDVPWHVSIDGGVRTLSDFGFGRMGKATAISQRHLIATGSFLFLEDLYISGGKHFDFGDCKTRQVDISSAAVPILKIRPCLKKKCDLPQIKAKRVVYIGDCYFRGRFRNTGFLVIELESDLPASTVPVCVAEERVKVGDKVQRFSYEDTPKDLTAVTVDYFAGNTDAFAVFLNHPPGAKGELGDSFVKNVSGRLTLVAMDYAGQENPTLYELNIGLFSEKICRITGVCGPKMLKRDTVKPLPRSKKLIPAGTVKPQVTKGVTKPPVTKVATKPPATKPPITKVVTKAPLISKYTRHATIIPSPPWTYTPLVPKAPGVTMNNSGRVIVLVSGPEPTSEPVVKKELTKPPVVTRAPKVTEPSVTSRPVTLAPTTTSSPPPPPPSEEVKEEVQNHEESREVIREEIREEGREESREEYRRDQQVKQETDKSDKKDHVDPEREEYERDQQNAAQETQKNIPEVAHANPASPSAHHASMTVEGAPDEVSGSVNFSYILSLLLFVILFYEF